MESLSDILSTVESKDSECWGERRLWAEVIQQTFYRATIGEMSAINFFRSEMFHQLCGMLNLPEQLMQERVVSRTKLNQQRKETGQ